MAVWPARLRAIDIELFSVGGNAIHLSSLLKLVAMLVLLVMAAGLLRRLALRRLLSRTPLEAGTQQAIGALIRYLVLVVGVLAILQTAGFDLTTFNVVAGALGVGVGFGLQNIFSNFVSGLILILERPIRVGDRIELGALEGRVEEIGSRRVTLLTNDNIALIVPNQRFITENVTNLSAAGGRIRVQVTVGVAPGSNLRLVERLMLEAAQDQAGVLADPPPGVHLLSLGGAAVSFELLVWTSSMVHSRRALVSALNFEIGQRFAAHGIRGA
jgi:small-conductance mechanosensitive channel